MTDKVLEEQNTYFYQNAAITLEYDLFGYVPIEICVQQIDIFSLDVNSFYSEIVTINLDAEKSVRADGSTHNNTRYADDTILLAKKLLTKSVE